MHFANLFNIKHLFHVKFMPLILKTMFFGPNTELKAHFQIYSRSRYEWANDLLSKINNVIFMLKVCCPIYIIVSLLSQQIEDFGTTRELIFFS